MYRCWECQHPKPFSAAQGVIAWPSSCGGKGTIIELAFHCSSPPMGPQLRMGHPKPTLEVMKKGKVLKIGLQYVPVCYSMLQYVTVCYSELALWYSLYVYISFYSGSGYTRVATWNARQHRASDPRWFRCSFSLKLQVTSCLQTRWQEIEDSVKLMRFEVKVHHMNPYNSMYM